jgi:DNA invertase Pin-like site-specific DNA recombinase
MTRIACAIYTRKSSDEGLEKEFNSLDAQREACEAFITSQKYAGWVAVRDLYDDGGLSGGTLERPALQRLLSDIKAGKVQIVVVYKVDRLTRSLADFAKIVDVLDAHGASFVSVTQQFNTTTSMGRLTLNMLLSFAQFEREIAGERIRDKIAASKAKGMWMGGTVPLGYDAKDRKLVINEAEAKLVRHIFTRYAELGSVRLLQAELDAHGHRSKRREGAGGLIAGDRPFSRGILYLILQNRLYRGELAHKGNVYPGQHEAIVEADLWTRVQETLTASRRDRKLAVGAKAPSLLAGLIFDSDGNRMTPTHANKRGRRYRYYISTSHLDRRKAGPNALRVPASEIDALVLGRLRALLASRQETSDALASLGLQARQLEAALERAQALAKEWQVLPPDQLRALTQSIVTRVTLSSDRVDVTLGVNRLGQELGVPVKRSDGTGPTIVLAMAAELRQAGQGKRLVIGEPDHDTRDAGLIEFLKEAFLTRQMLLADTSETLNEITARSTKSKGRLTALMRVSYLAPDIIADILAGRQPPELSVKRLVRNSKNLPLDWTSQRAFLGMA